MKPDDNVSIIMKGKGSIYCMFFLCNFTLYSMWSFFGFYLIIGFSKIHTDWLQGLIISIFTTINFFYLVVELAKFDKIIIALKKEKIKMIQEDQH